MSIRRLSPVHFLCATLLALVPSIAHITGVHASVGGTDCAHGYHVVDSACQNNSTDTYYGAYASFNDANMYLTTSAPAGAFILDDLWVYTSTDEGTWVENYDMYGPGYNCGGCYQHAAWWAESTSTGFSQHHIGQLFSNNSTHSFDVERNFSYANRWTVYFDQNNVNASGNQPSGVAYEVASGLEIAARPAPSGFYSDISWAHSDTINNNSMLVYSVQSGAWRGWWYQHYWRDQPCGNPTYPYGQCTNGSNVYNGSAVANYWSINKP